MSRNISESEKGKKLKHIFCLCIFSRAFVLMRELMCTSIESFTCSQHSILHNLRIRSRTPQHSWLLHIKGRDERACNLVKLPQMRLLSVEREQTRRVQQRVHSTDTSFLIHQIYICSRAGMECFTSFSCKHSLHVKKMNIATFIHAMAECSRFFGKLNIVRINSVKYAGYVWALSLLDGYSQRFNFPLRSHFIFHFHSFLSLDSIYSTSLNALLLNCKFCKIQTYFHLFSWRVRRHKESYVSVFLSLMKLSRKENSIREKTP